MRNLMDISKLFPLPGPFRSMVHTSIFLSRTETERRWVATWNQAAKSIRPRKSSSPRSMRLSISGNSPPILDTRNWSYITRRRRQLPSPTRLSFQCVQKFFLVSNSLFQSQALSKTGQLGWIDVRSGKDFLLTQHLVGIPIE